MHLTDKQLEDIVLIAMERKTGPKDDVVPFLELSLEAIRAVCALAEQEGEACSRKLLGRVIHSLDIVTDTKNNSTPFTGRIVVSLSYVLPEQWNPQRLLNQWDAKKAR